MYKKLFQFLLISVFVGFFGTAQAEIRITAIDVGQGDCVLVQSESHSILIDGGWNYDEVADTLKNMGVTHVDVVVGTHGHADHIGGLVGVLKRKQVDTVIYNGQTHTSNTFEYFVDAVAESGTKYHEPSRGEFLDLGDMRLEVLHPKGSAADYTGHLHDKSIVTRIVYGDFAIIVSGDIERQGEREILADGANVSAQVLELGHHGSRTSTSEEWLKAVGPELAFYQAGEGNRYGHPHSETISLLKRNGVKVIGTDTHGNIVITAQRDGSFSVESSKDTGKFGLQDETNSEAPSTSSDCIDLNTASPDEMDDIIHIGDDRAEAVVQGRPWDSVRDLTKIRGIGQARIEDIKKQGLVCE